MMKIDKIVTCGFLIGFFVTSYIAHTEESMIYTLLNGIFGLMLSIIIGRVVYLYEKKKK